MNLKSLKSRLPNFKSAAFYIVVLAGLMAFSLSGCGETSELSKELADSGLFSDSGILSDSGLFSEERENGGFNEAALNSTENEAATFFEFYNPYTGELTAIPEYSGEPLLELNNGEPFFSEEDLSLAEDKREPAFEYYSELDELGRCEGAFAKLGEALLPTESRGDISSVRPSGWHSVRFPFVDGESVYNRCHLIAHSLAGEDANENNLITGTRYMNVKGMLPIEEELRELVYDGEESIIYRVTPCFYENELVARGVLIEAYSGADKGRSAELCYFAYNVQPGIDIDYESGYVDLSDEVLYVGDYDESLFGSPEYDDSAYDSYVLNIGSWKFHEPDCIGVEDIKQKSRRIFVGEREVLILNDFKPCGICRP